MRAGPAAVGFGQVWHRRNRPSSHEFSYPVNQVWLDPDRPEELFDRHRLWSARSPRPIRFRRRDYFDGTSDPIGPAVRSKLAEPLGAEPAGPVRMLTQPRIWGWLFNPITIYLAWDRDPSSPAGAVLEVTNTPWKERMLYPVALHRDGDRFRAVFDKALHVSPFLERDYVYELSVRSDAEDRELVVGLDVVRAEGDEPVVETQLCIRRETPTRAAMTTALYRNPLPTHRVSLGIHWQAARLLRKRVPFVSHPRRRS